MNLNSSIVQSCGVLWRIRWVILLAAIAVVISRPRPASADAPSELQPRIIVTAHEDQVQAVAFSPDGLSLATSGKDERLLVWDVKTARYAQRYDHDSEITQIHWAPDGKMLTARGPYNAPVIIKPGEFPTPLSEGYTYTVNSVFNRSGTVMALSACLDGPPFNKDTKYGLEFWKLPDMEKTELEITTERGLREIDFSPDGSLIAGAYEKKVGADNQQAVTTIWDAATGKVVTSFSGKPYSSWAWFHMLVRFSPDGKSLLYRKSDTNFAVWDIAAKKDRVEFTPAKDSKFVACSPDARWLAAAAGNKIFVWDSASGKLAFTLGGASGSIEALDVSSSGLVAAGTGLAVSIWALPGAGNGAVIPPATQPAGAPVAVAPDGGPFASAVVATPATKPATAPAGDDAPERPLFDAPDVRPARAIRGRGGRIIAFAITSDGRALATSQFMADAHVYDLVTGQNLPAPEGFWGATRFCITDDRQHLIGTGDQGLWMRHAKNMHWRSVKNTETVNALLLDSATGQFLAGSSDGQVTSWKLAPAADEGDALLATLKGGRNIREVALSSDGKYVAAAGFTTARPNVRGEYTLALTVWDRKTGTIVASADGGAVSSDEASLLALPVAFANDNRTILYRYNERDFVTWDWQGAAQIRTITMPIPTSLAAFSPDGKLLASLALREQEPELQPAVHVWDTATGRLLWNLKGIAPCAQVGCVGFSPDGKTIVANSGKTIMMWSTPVQAAPK